MSIELSILLGFVQALTEFLPISSSGHLALLELLFGGAELGTSLTFNVMVHFATLLATVVFLRNELKEIIYSFFSSDATKRNSAHRTSLSVLVAIFPAALVGLFLRNYVQHAMQSFSWLGAGFLLTSVLLFFTQRMAKNSRPQSSLSESLAPSLKVSLIIGLLQAVAILPGVSRSGATICASLLLGLNRTQAVQFSFLISIPVIFAATILEVGNITASELPSCLVGFIVAAIFAWFAIKLLLKVISHWKLWLFAVYTGFLGIVCLVV